MFGRASTQYNAAYQAVIAQGTALGQSAAPETIGDVNHTLQSGQQTAKAQADALLADVKGLRAEMADLKTEQRATNRQSVTNTDQLKDSHERTSRETQNAMRANKIARLAS
jgi:hypothetical protein